MSVIGFIILALWLWAGALGAWLLWRSEMKFNGRLNRRAPEWCPTPRALLLGSIAALMGVILLAASLIITLIDWIDECPARGNWFTRPICKREK